MKTTPVDGRGTRPTGEPGPSNRRPDAHEKGKQKVRTRPKQEIGERDREDEPDRREEPTPAAQPNQEAQQDVPILARSDVMLMPIRAALDMVEEQYTPLYNAVRGIGNVLRRADVKEFPEMVTQIRREGNGIRKESTGTAQLMREQKKELRQAKRTIWIIEQQDRTCFQSVSRLFRPDGEVQTKARLYDEMMSDSEEEGAEWVKSIDKKYAARVEEALMEFRALATEVLTRCLRGAHPYLNRKWGRPATRVLK
jgi:hypothetical protein